MNNGLWEYQSLRWDSAVWKVFWKMALTLTVQASQVKAQEYHRQQGFGLQNSPLWLPWQFLTRWQSSASLCAIRGATQKTESGKVEQELKWPRSFDDPSMWWENRAKHGNNYPNFEHGSAGEGLWIGSSYHPKWVQPKLKCLEDAGLGIRTQYREGDSFQSGRSSYLETKLKDGRETFSNCNEMQQQKVSIPVVVAALKASSSSRDLERGKKIHADAIESGNDSNIYVATKLVEMYAKCGSMGDSHRVFDRMPRHDVVLWTALVLGYAENGEGEVALQLFARMGPEGCAPDGRTFVAALKACTSLAAKEEGKQVDGKLMKMGSLEKGMAIHSQAAKSSCDSNIYVASTLVDMYAKCGSLVDARGVFDKMPLHDVVLWSALILGYTENGEAKVALQLFARMRFEGCAPDSLIFVAALKACTSLAAKEEAKQVDGKLVKMGSFEKGMAIHSQAAKSACDSDIFVASILVDMYAKCGSMVDARGVFDRMPNHNVVSWSALILGYIENGEGELALQLFACMRPAPNSVTYVAALKACTILATKEEGKQVEGKLVKMGFLEKGMTIHSQAANSGCDSDMFVASTLVDMYAKCGSMVDARAVFDRMLRHNVVSLTALMLGYAENGEGKVALQLFVSMRTKGFAPDALTFVAALKACGSVAALEIGKTIHADICRSGLERNVVVANCLVSFYGKCGSMVDAQQVFDSLDTRDLVTWTALIAGYSRQGDTKHVFDLFERMQKERVQANGITFLSILTACSHAGLVDRGKEYFQVMCSKYGISPAIEHYHCMVDILGRANRLDEAVAMVKTMPFKPNAVTWMTVLGACQKWKNVVVGRLAFDSLLRVDEKEPAAYALMANIYGSVGMWEEKSKVQAMRNARSWKKPGQSWWTDEAGTVHTFVAGDTSHPQSEDIQAKLKNVLVKMKEHGYVVDVGSVLRDISDDEKEDALCGHSEKLAIACALVNTVPGTTIRIVKNLRVCDDCHKATAIISKVEQRPIICRDASRFHVFKDGKCSCGDFW